MPSRLQRNPIREMIDKQHLDTSADQERPDSHMHREVAPRGETPTLSKQFHRLSQQHSLVRIALEVGRQPTCDV